MVKRWGKQKLLKVFLSCKICFDSPPVSFLEETKHLSLEPKRIRSASIAALPRLGGPGRVGGRALRRDGMRPGLGQGAREVFPLGLGLLGLDMFGWSDWEPGNFDPDDWG